VETVWWLLLSMLPAAFKIAPDNGEEPTPMTVADSALPTPLALLTVSRTALGPIRLLLPPHTLSTTATTVLLMAQIPTRTRMPVEFATVVTLP
jgi:hypothetical protein